MDLSGNTVLITGGATGIGFHLAQSLVDRGNRVLICGRREQRLREAQRSVPSLETLCCDVGSARGRRQLLEWSIRIAPALNVLVNNAGIQNHVNLLDGDVDASGHFDEISINLEAPIHLSMLFVAQLARQDRAAILNITSGLAFTPIARAPVYCATKAALHSFSLSLRHQLRNSRIKVFEVAPPLVQSELHDHQADSVASTAGKPTIPAMSTEEFVAECLRAFEQDRYTTAVGMAANFYEQREKLFSTLNPA